MTALAVDTMQGLSKCIYSNSFPWYPLILQKFCVNGAIGLFIDDVSDQLPKWNAQYRSTQSHTSQKVSHSSQTLRSTFKHNVPFENVATVSPPVTHNWRSDVSRDLSQGNI